MCVVSLPLSLGMLIAASSAVPYILLVAYLAISGPTFVPILRFFDPVIRIARMVPSTIALFNSFCWPLPILDSFRA